MGDGCLREGEGYVILIFWLTSLQDQEEELGVQLGEENDVVRAAENFGLGVGSDVLLNLRAEDFVFVGAGQA